MTRNFLASSLSCPIACHRVGGLVGEEREAGEACRPSSVRDRGMVFGCGVSPQIGQIPIVRFHYRAVLF